MQQADRIEAIRSIAQKGGFTEDAQEHDIWGQFKFLADAVMAGDRSVPVNEVFKRAFLLMPNTNEAHAIKNALLAKDWTESLGDRRERYMAETGQSLRTVIRHEVKGAELLSDYIEHAIRDLKAEYDSSDSDNQVQFLRRRVEKLELEVEELVRWRNGLV